MDYFSYKDGKLFCEDVDLQKVAIECGTPCYVYSKKTLELIENFEKLKSLEEQIKEKKIVHLKTKKKFVNRKTYKKKNFYKKAK